MKNLLLLISILVLFAFYSCDNDSINSDSLDTNTQIKSLEEEQQLTPRMPYIVENRKYGQSPYYSNNIKTCNRQTNSLCIYNEYTGEWSITAPGREGNEHLVRGSYSSLVNLTVYSNHISIDLIKYSDQEMIREIHNPFIISNNVILSLENSNQIEEVAGIRNIKLLEGEYDFIPAERGDESKLGTFIISADVEAIYPPILQTFNPCTTQQLLSGCTTTDLGCMCQ